MKIEIDGVATVIESQIGEDGRIYGLKKFAGRKAKVVVLDE
jgi:hypothetical protein